MSTIAEMLGKLIDGKGFTPYQVARDTGVSLWSSRLHVPKVFVIVHRYDGIVVKEVTDRANMLPLVECRPGIPGFFLSLNDVVQLFYIKELMRRNAL